MDKRRFQKDNGKKTFQGGRRTSSQAKTCFQCGGSYPHTKVCPAKTKTCNKCQKKGHFARCCRSKDTSTSSRPLNQMTAGSSSSSQYVLSYSESDVEAMNTNNLWAISSTTDKVLLTEASINEQSNVNYLETFTIELVVENCKVEFLIDSGSALNILNLKIFNKLNSKNSLKLRKTDKRVLTYGINKPSLSIKGVTTLFIENNNKLITKEFYVISTQNKNLLSGHTAIELNLLSIPVNYTQEESDFRNKIKQVPNRLKPLINKYENTLFSGKIGTVKNVKIKLHTDEKVQPVAQRERRIPFALREKVKLQIEKGMKPSEAKIKALKEME